jgi:hypothetical protein
LRLFRAISRAELRDFRIDHQFRTAANTLEGKQFFKSEVAVREFAEKAFKRNYSPPYVSYLVVSIDEDCLANTAFYSQELDGFEAITVDEDNLPSFNNCVTFEEQHEFRNNI